MTVMETSSISTFWKGCSDNLDVSLDMVTLISRKTDLVNKSTMMDIVMNKNLGPKVVFTALDEILGLLLQHMMLHCYESRLVDLRLMNVC